MDNQDPNSDSEKYWYKPNITRDRAVQILKNSNPGDFVVRDSKSFHECYDLCIRVEKHQVSLRLCILI